MSTVTFGPPDRRKRTPGEKAVRFVVALAMLACASYGIFGTRLVAPTPRNLSIGLASLVVYLLVAYFVDLEPDYENLGYSPFSGHSGKLPVGLGLFFDDPFQASDNVSREFLFHRFMLSPGRFIAIALTDPLFPSRKRQHR